MIFVTVTLVPLLGLVGFVTDFGWAYWRREACQTAAEAAAEAAALAAKAAGTYTVVAETECPATPSSGTPWQVACLYATANGFTNGSNRQTVKVSAGTSSAPVSGISPGYWITTTVSENMPTLFSAVLGHSAMKVSARATSAVYAASGGCVYVLNPTALHAWFANGSSFTTGCGINVNSNNAAAFDMNGGTLTLNNSAAVNVHGGAVAIGATISPWNVNTYQPSISDPISGYTAPTVGGTCTSYTLSSSSATINPGTYCSITTNGGTLTLTSGTYVISTGSLQLNGGMIDATSGVTFYFPPTNTHSINNFGGTLKLTAPTSGSYQGMAFWQAAGDTAGANMNGGTNTVNGIIYVPGGKLTYNGGNVATSTTIVCDTIQMDGGVITQPANSSHLANGYFPSGAYMVE
ncbi:MAG TPA: pilus assembly protein TadG-related protein [Bryobacteraceae bacterium]